MYKLDIPVDPKQTAAIERRRNAELNRQSRIFNARQRTIGVDQPFLDHQVAERKTRDDRERLRNEAFDADRLRYDAVALLLEQEESHRRQRIEQDLVGFRQLHQQPQDSRDYDLSDPLARRKDAPARGGDADPRLGPASLQTFAGEDLARDTRVRLQREQSRGWLEEQRREREREERDRRHADDLYQRKATELDRRAVELSKMEEDCRRALNTATLNYNMALATEGEALRGASLRREGAEEMAELGAQVYGPMLTEDPEAAASCLGPDRPLAHRWKGMSGPQLQEIRQAQRQQALDAQTQRMKEAQVEGEWERQRLTDARGAMALERAEGETAARLRRETDVYNKQLGQEQAANQNFLDTQVYTNEPTAEYFLQFNTSSR